MSFWVNSFTSFHWLYFIITSLTIIGNAKFGRNIGTVSNEFRLDITPVSWTFSIWGVIYTLLLVLSFVESNNTVIWLYVLQGALNIVWIFAWSVKELKLSSILLLCLCVSLWYSVVLSEPKSLQSETFTIYATWTTGASLINIGSYLVSLEDDYENLISWLIPIIYTFLPFIFYYFNVDFSGYLTIIWTSVGILANCSKQSYVAVLSLLFGIIGAVLYFFNIQLIM